MQIRGLLRESIPDEAHPFSCLLRNANNGLRFLFQRFIVIADLHAGLERR